MQVRSAADSAKKFVSRAGAAQNDYAAGVAGAGNRWQAGAEASEQAYVQGTQEAIAQGRFGKGVRAAGGAKYQDKATKLGPARFATGVAAAENDYAKGVQPHLSAMASFDPGPKGMRGSPQNAQRSLAVQQLNRKIRLERLGS